ncbi:MAG TPA: hypothetical protein PKE12_13470 [Kiritimatiellia bacterium]|nr:hypothetical protein [Kiritimatiellia bacterium]
MDSCTLSLAGHQFSFEPAGAESVRLPPAFDSFRAPIDAAPVTARYRVHPANAAQWTSPAEVDQIWQTDTWRMGRTPDGDYVLAIHVLPDERPLAVARFAPDFSHGDLLCRAGRHGAPTPFAFNYPCDQVAVLNALNPHGIGIVHAGAVAIDGNGLLFCGRSGAGKTTLSRLCRDAGATLLNDDRQFVWAGGTGVCLAPTPWHGLEPEINNKTVPLRAIFHLVQAPATRCTLLSPIDSAAKLLGNTVAPFYRADAMARTLAWTETITARVPSYLLEFTPTADAVNACRGILESS